MKLNQLQTFRLVIHETKYNFILGQRSSFQFHLEGEDI